MRLLVVIAVTGLGLAAFASSPPSRDIKFKQAKLLVEHNATDGDTGFQGFVDGDAWRELRILDPDGRVILQVEGKEGLGALGLTELFFETQEPSNAVVPIQDLLATLPPGKYDYRGTTLAGVPMKGTAQLTHDIPAAPVIVSPTEDAVVDPAHVVIDWEPVTQSLTGGTIDIVAYQLIVEKVVSKEAHPDAFAKILMSVHVPPSVTRMSIPSEFLEPNTSYEFEVLAIEKSGNQTISSSAFKTQ